MKKMNKKITTVIIILLLLTTFSSLSVAGEQSTKKIKSQNAGKSSDIVVNIGNMTIGENFIDFAVNDKYVYLKPGIKEITIIATVYFRLHGWCDHGYAYLGLWDQPHNDSADHGETADVTLSFTISDCKPGDEFEIELKGEYTDCINPDFVKRKKCIVNLKEVGDNPIYIGDMYIDGYGDPETAIVRSTAVQTLRIPVDESGSDLTFEIRYEMNCAGSKDNGIVDLWVRGGDAKKAKTGEYEAGYLYTTITDCTQGENIEWTLTTTYLPNHLSIPIVSIDGGLGQCNRNRVNNRESSSLLLQFLHRFTNQFPCLSMMLKNLANCLYTTTSIAKGTIVCI